MRLSDHRVAVISLAVAVVFGIIASYLAYLAVFPPQRVSITVIPSFAGSANVVLGPNGSVTAGTNTEINGLDGFIFNGSLTHIYLTVSNTGNTPVFLQQIVLITNVTVDRTQIEAIESGYGSVSPEQSQTYVFTLDSQGWALGVVKCTFTVTGDGIEGGALMTLGVVQNPLQR